VVRAAFGVNAPARARLLWFGLSRWLLLALFLIPGLPAVGNFRQDFPQFIDVCFCPHVNDTATNLNNLRCWNFLFGYVAAQSFYPKIRIDRPSGSRAAALKITQ